ncbi:hypothetical protein PCE1_003344 [Barthelona sp. PCE]
MDERLCSIRMWLTEAQMREEHIVSNLLASNDSLASHKVGFHILKGSECLEKAHTALQSMESTELPDFDDFVRGLRKGTVESIGIDDIPTRVQSNTGFKTPIYTGLEQFGKTLDLTEIYTKFCNVYETEAVEYTDFVERMPFYMEKLSIAKGFDVVDMSYHYLLEYLTKSNPLLDTAEIEGDINDAFVKVRDESVCEVCNKQFGNANVFIAHMNSKKHKRRASNPQEHKKPITTFIRNQIGCVLLHSFYVENGIIDSTIELIESLENHTLAELQHIKPTDTETQHVARKVQRPLDFDGEPIPFFLFKASGMNVEYTCEICGNHVYKGHRSFENHFIGARHTYGLECLGIKNSDVFNGITKVKDALLLAKNLQKN